jgi:hypothetical protein
MLERAKILRDLKKLVGKEKVDTEYMPQHDFDLICGDCYFLYRT